MSELLGGERITIVAGTTIVQTFERTMSDAQRRHVKDDENAVIDLWRLVTPISAKQERKLPPLPALDVRSLPLEEQSRVIVERVRRQKGRERINARTRGVKVVVCQHCKQPIPKRHGFVCPCQGRTEAEDGWVTVQYNLGHGIPLVADYMLWDILDAAARDGESRIDAKDLAGRITARR